ncbi:MULTISPECIES: NAD(P)/FAD-dependent oxidoreductase [unclassified Massilia]|uniref:NAD(P)/FAD-dependent oxidoreductase n=1 Tax=unclassified Massilia TaxID=2609279 RepID=UPI0017819E6C|nr:MULTISPECIES: NAD(P)/FAD-dependent oxidoreductase [unclassified Massilia]MBD8532093.1 NAD(P)/FAD-dependent oxidoreductase [Massilia sp. CFBP 13647]MBD8675539.1 NAD(P)/FAD-dependent oxidoreductase [Massilia sp. CFBP 13721]
MHVTTTPEFDAIVIGGSYAGLSAATQLARARRRVLVIDAGQRRNRFAHASHGFLTQDGTEAAVIAATARGQLLNYPNVRWIEGTAAQAQAQGDGFIVTLADGTACTGRRLVLATGVRDELPPIAGLQERWGRSVFHCPYCHGYELDAGAIGVLAAGPLSMHHALMLPDWGTVTLFLNGAFEPDAAQLAALDGRGVTLERTAIARIDGAADVVLADGRMLPMAGLFVAPQMHAASPIAAQLGCATEDGPMGAFVGTDAMQASSVPGVFCCGDMARAAGNVAFAVADGAMAGVAAHRSLMELHPA